MSTPSIHRYCVIMCGGVGSRFWPYSREDCPKQFIDFLGTGRSLLQMSYDRILPLVPKENIIVVTNEKYAGLIREQLPDILPSNILLEPARRNTAPCIAWAAYHIAALDPEASMIVTPSDHLITRENIFEDCVRRGFEFVESHDALLTLGITPVRPETGYGYIQIGQEAEPGILKVKTFTEKPNLELAKVFLDSGEFFWNSGIFLWKASSIISALHKYDPDLTCLFDRGVSDFGTPREMEFINANFTSCPPNSIDYAVMEKADNVYVECVNFGWNDLGTWSALYDNSPCNEAKNVAQNCNVLAYESTGNMFAVQSPDKLVVVQGLKDYIIADAGDVLLICPKAEEQRIKQMVTDAKLSFGDKYL
ncbi:mannose-1-phosphate guanylyltransferase [uncultured Duncaniella sp.]|uniref:mannose-1-phosphate guanylyltransferase n=1 Tax=uncultured Duncaniella sp. TaxID=2768039 RepID=UPI0023D1920D|nr:mannose-1-phosphate guanylyltransferase [uncultured Duncaniella sp.]MDE5664985.1 mannose-1-phosphate guanylyltransferase [Duncaniella sp.]MDE5672393.1 mannose-1-phosphate guanylyltransferase [Duncaniella sp.]MDE5954705.1 mannose-1-phosphate guanylyltransferase [Duncaniella sp.]MDE5961841.1 mannose-1-phosphate guanylyltransferase [Duncaniella sp.]MDE6186835.1 mannose-1-phosphate guanylyltransferase [Duncaniella sp.]